MSSTSASSSSSSSFPPESWSTSLLKSFLQERGINTSLTFEKSDLISAAMTCINMEERAIRECEQPTIIDIKDLSPSNAALRFESHLTSILPKQIRATVTPVKQKRTGIISYQLALSGQAMVATGSLWNAMIQAFLLAHTPKFTSVSNSIIYHPRRCPSDMSQDEFELTEFSDSQRVIRAKVAVLARIITIHKSTVVYTGAGVSTSAKIADFRGPNGVWTARDFNRPKAKSVPFEVAQPTLTHWMIKYGLDMGIFRYCTSQNVDGLHRRSGIPVSSLSELHGNCFREICASCGADHIRDFSTTSKKGPHFRGVQDKTKISHITGRKCETCGEGMLRDSVIHFHESLPARDLERSEQHARESYCSFVMGSSLKVTPAADLPALCRGPMIIVNLQATGRDQECLQSGGFIIHGKTDVVSALLLDALSIPISSIVPSSYEIPSDLAPTLLPILEKQKSSNEREEEKEQTTNQTSTSMSTSKSTSTSASTSSRVIPR